MSVTFLSSRELSKRPGRVLRNLKKNGLQVVTQNGQPTAVLLPLKPEAFEEEMTSYLGYKAHRAMVQCQAAARRNGLAKLSLRGINAGIKAARAERRRENLGA